MDIRLLSRICWDWGVRCFGIEHMLNTNVRALRAAEEMIELSQALGVDAAKLHSLIDIVYSRQVGEPSQEFGGLMLTTMVLAWGQNVKLEHCLEEEILRCLSKPPEHFTKRNQIKIDMGLA